MQFCKKAPIGGGKYTENGPHNSPCLNSCNPVFLVAVKVGGRIMLLASVPGILSKLACVLVTVLISHTHTNKKWRRVTTHGASPWQLSLFFYKKGKFHKHANFMAASYANASAPSLAPFNLGVFHFLKISLRNTINTLLDCTSFPQPQLFLNSSNSRGGERQQHFVWNQALQCLLILHAPTVVARV